MRVLRVLENLVGQYINYSENGTPPALNWRVGWSECRCLAVSPCNVSPHNWQASSLMFS